VSLLQHRDQKAHEGRVIGVNPVAWDKSSSMFIFEEWGYLLSQYMADYQISLVV